MMTAYDIIKRPVITEKSEMLRREYNKYTFEVNTKANKIQIKKAVEQLFNVKPFKKSYIPDGKKGEEACAEYNQILKEHPIDLQILGLGQNGHIGFNEPGTPFTTPTHKVQLTKSTIEANKRFFDCVEDVPTEAYSMGIDSIMQAKSIILLAYGEKKADAVAKMIQGEITEDLPASILQKHPDVTIIIDEAAAKDLKH